MRSEITKEKIITSWLSETSHWVCVSACVCAHSGSCSLAAAVWCGRGGCGLCRHRQTQQWWDRRFHQYLNFLFGNKFNKTGTSQQRSLIFDRVLRNNMCCNICVLVCLTTQTQSSSIVLCSNYHLALQNKKLSLHTLSRSLRLFVLAATLVSVSGSWNK